MYEKGSFSLPGVMWAKQPEPRGLGWGLGFGLGFRV